MDIRGQAGAQYRRREDGAVHWNDNVEHITILCTPVFSDVHGGKCYGRKEDRPGVRCLE